MSWNTERQMYRQVGGHVTERKEWPIARKTLLEASSGWHDIGEGEVGEWVMGVGRPVGWTKR